ncbi:hypothetical protein E3N88_33010 [Mikania micrantha]|uniref:CCHC-type domain-containing protein n=1 Tax=Mikania micrantha TaxID=192012 RepID=A0A5N6MA74_9ASTR|nr:hypothetical protein E3N88_33010 [Mikania micrantha]
MARSPSPQRILIYTRITEDRMRQITVYKVISVFISEYLVRKVYSGQAPKCNRCPYHHTGPCPVCRNCNQVGHYAKYCDFPAQPSNHAPRQTTQTNRSCFKCGSPDHLMRNYPNNDNTNPGNEARGADKSFISPEFASLLSLPVVELETPYVIELANGKLIKTNNVIQGCSLNLNDYLLNIDLLPIELGSFDVVVGMDWISDNQAEVVYQNTVIRILLPDGNTLIVQGERAGRKLGVISCMQTQKCLRKGCPAFLTHVIESSSLQKRIENIPVVKEFPEVFPDDISRLPPVRQVEFRIDLIPGATPVAKAPYHLALSEMQELSGQLQELRKSCAKRSSYAPGIAKRRLSRKMDENPLGRYAPGHASTWGDAPGTLKISGDLPLSARFMEPLFSGKYPNTMIQNVTNNRLPKFTNDQSKLLMGSYDFLGLNYYVSQYATTAPATNVVSLLTDNKVLEQPDNLNGIPIGIQGGLDWLYSYPPGFYKLLVYIKNTYGDPLIYVMENGWVDKTDNTKTVEQARVDSERIDYHNKHLQHLQYAIRQVNPSVAAPEITMLNNLDVSIDDYIIKVRILRKWRQPDRKYPNEDYSIEMILIDEEGNKILGHVLKKWFFRFEKYLNESDCLLIKRPSLGINLSKYKFVDNPNKLNFNYQTYVSKCNDFVGQEHGFSFSSFQTVKDNLLPENITIGNPYVSNSFGSEVSRLFINDEVDDIIKYKKRLMKKTVDDPSSIQLPFGLSMFCSLQDDFLTNTAFTNIGEICEIFEVKCVVIIGTIKTISKDMCWYYMACERCNRKVGTKYVTRFKEDGSGDFEDEKVFECNNPKCNVKVVSPVPRFKIQIRVQDITGVVSLTLFDRDVTKLIQKTAREVLDDLNEEDDFGKYPSEITHLLEKKFAFKIEVSEFNLKNNYQVYGILKLTDDSTVISELDKRFNIIQVKTFTVDNTTPFSKVKRKLVDIYDLECESSVRDKKLHASDYEENKLDVASKIPLLDPKVEKF